MSTISNTIITTGVTIGTAGYDSPLTIAPGSYVGNDAGNAIYSGSVATVVNAGSIDGSGTGILLNAGGTVTNQSGGTISGYVGVAAYNAAATVVNAGSIAGYFPFGSRGAGRGIALFAGGSVTNQAGGTISGFYGIGAQNVAVTVVNAGSIGGPGDSVYLGAGGYVSNQSGGTIGGGFQGIYAKAPATVVNAGNIDGSGTAIILNAGGAVTNQVGGTITGSWGIDAADVGATVVNAGVIAQYDSASSGYAVLLQMGGSVINQSGGTISGFKAVDIRNAAATVVNAGSIGGFGSAGIGVYLQNGGSVTNQAGGTISGGAYAVRFAGGYDHRLVIDADAVIIGTVTGGNTIGASSISTLELASGASTGTISGLGTQFVDFAQVTVDAGAQWVISGFNIIASGETLTNSGIDTVTGTLVNAGRVTGAENAVALGARGQITNQSGGTIAGSNDAITGSGAGTVVNAGLLSGFYGVYLGAGGLVTNLSGGRISGTAVGIRIFSNGTVSNLSGGTISGYAGIADRYAPVTVVNAGVIAGATSNASGFGVVAYQGGSVTNLSGGTITARDGVAIEGAAGQVQNAGSIGGNSSNGIGVELSAGSSLTNQSGGTISGGTDAVAFGAGQNNLLLIDPGAVFIGTVTGGNTLGAAAVSTLKLGSGASEGTLSGLGSLFVNFGSIAFGAGADWFIEGSTAGLAGPITGFAAGDTIDIDGITVTGSSYAAGVLTLDEASGSASLNLVGDFTTNQFVVTNVAGGVEVALCFCVDTLIETPMGGRPVQNLVAGDLVVTWGGAVRPIAWVGTGSVLATPGRRNAATPVIVRKGALRDNVPYQDLRVTKGHSFLVDNVLIPVEFLVNYCSILWDDRGQEVQLYHIELETHDVLIANGAPAESYRDDGNRWLFQNANDGWDQPVTAPCAPVLTGGPVVDAAWRRLLDRAGPHPLPAMTDDPDLHLVIDGARVDPLGQQGSVYFFRLPSSPKSVVIASRTGVPSELAIARDPRSLGVALRQVAMRQGAKFMLIDADDARLTAGFHAYEADCNLRWTDGCAHLPIEAFARFDEGAEVMLHLGGVTRYPDELQGMPVAAAPRRA